MKKAFSYLRVSSKIQIEGDGFPRQRETIANYAQRNNIEVVREFMEEGVSGTKESPDREALTALLIAIEESDVKLILVERSDRLARHVMVSEVLLTRLEKLGVRVISADSGTDLTVADGDPTKKLIRQILGIFAEYEKNVLVAKLSIARARRRAAGGRDGRKPYGFNQGEQDVIAYMRTLNNALTYQGVADKMNADGILTRNPGARWHATSVRRILMANP